MKSLAKQLGGELLGSRQGKHGSSGKHGTTGSLTDKQALKEAMKMAKHKGREKEHSWQNRIWLTLRHVQSSDETKLWIEGGKQNTSTRGEDG